MSENKQNKKIYYNNVTYLLNEDERTAGVLDCKNGIKKVFIPSSINYESKEYIITSILKCAFKNSNIKHIKFASDSKIQIIESSAFQSSYIERIKIPSQVKKIGENAFSYSLLEKISIPEDSMLQTICKNAFYLTFIYRITIPSKLVELQNGWCNETEYLRHFKVSPDNPRYCNYENAFIIGKSSIDQSNYDQLVFCARGAPTTKIPSYIKYICPYTFNKCTIIRRIEFQSGSMLEKIGEKALKGSSVESIEIPSKLVEFGDNWCHNTIDFNHIIISPSNPIFCVFDGKYILRKSSIEQSYYDQLILCVRNIKAAQIPSFIEHICSSAFNECDEIEKIEFLSDSNLKIIDNNAFSFSTIASITIPSSVIRIGYRAFIHCDCLKEIKISTDSNLQIIEEEAIANTLIESFTIPSKLTELKESWCCQTKYLIHIEIDFDNPRFCSFDQKLILGKSSIEQSYYDQLVFCARDIETITIPYFIKHVCSSAFENCEKLTKIEIPNNSKLQTIGERAFSRTLIKNFIIPSQVAQIDSSVFRFCHKLNKIGIPNDSNIQIINSYVFANTGINSIIIPLAVTHIEEYAFSHCGHLQIIEIQENSKMEFMDENAFDMTLRGILMIPTKYINHLNL